MTCIPVNLTPDEATFIRLKMLNGADEALIRKTVAAKMEEALVRMLRAEQFVRQRNIADVRPGVPVGLR